MSKTLLNLSGHKLAEKAKEKLGEEFDLIEEIFVPNFDFQSDIESQLKVLIQNISAKLDGSSPITFIVPGHSSLAVLMFTYLYGLIGDPPDICLLQANDDGYYFPQKVFNSIQIKRAGRLLRNELWKKNNDSLD